MAITIRTSRLKIVEQIAIVLFFAVVIPMTISGFIINNINQQSVRNQLKVTAELIANMVSEEIDVFQTTATNELKQIVMTLNYFSTDNDKQIYLQQITKTSDVYKKLFIVNSYTEFQTIYDKCIHNDI